MLALVMLFYEEAQKALDKGANFDRLMALPVREDIARFKMVSEDEVDEWYASRRDELIKEMSRLCA